MKSDDSRNRPISTRNSKIYMDKKRKKAYREKQSFWIVTITIVILFTLGAVLVNSRGSKDKITAESLDSMSQDSGKSSNDANRSEDNAATDNINNLVKDKYPQIKTLVQEYFDAKNTANVDKLSKIMDNLPSDMKDILKSEKAYIESYSNIEIYTKAGLTDNAYVVYICYEIKFINIKTPAPGSAVLYVIKDEDTDTMCIHNYQTNEEAKSDIAIYIDTINKDEDVKEFYRTVESKLQAACEKDQELKNFCDELKKKVK